MSDKAIIVADTPESCSKCKFMYEFYGVKKCQLLNVLKNGGKAIICVDKLNVAKKECCPLISAEEHDKEIRDKAIEEYQKECAKFILNKRNEFVNEIQRRASNRMREAIVADTSTVSCYKIGIKEGLEEAVEVLDEIAEKMKEVRE